MALKYGFVFWLTFAMLFGSPQLLMVEGLECDVCVRHSIVPAQGPCHRIPCNSVQDTKMAEVVAKQDQDEAGVRSDLTSEAASASQPSQEMNEEGRGLGFVCRKGLILLSPDSVGVDGRDRDVWSTVAMCDVLDPSRRPQPQPYETLHIQNEGVQAESVLKQLWYFCDEKNEADCRVNEGGDKKKLDTVTVNSTNKASGRGRGHAPWILILVIVTTFFSFFSWALN